MRLWILKVPIAITSVALACFAVLPRTTAVTPPPDGAYPNQNTAEGHDALLSLTTGVQNTAMGDHALQANTTGVQNTAIGDHALKSNVAGDGNTASGSNALRNNTGGSNTADGSLALLSNTIGSYNTAIGFRALADSTTGYFNTAVGTLALLKNVNGSGNVAIGLDALDFNSIGNNNTAVGLSALPFNTTGNNNIGIGNSAGGNLTTGSNNIDIGNAGKAGESGKIRIGTEGTQRATLIAGIRGVTTTNMDAVPVVIDSAGQLGTASSSERFKKAIKPMENASEAVLALKPVTFQYNSDTTNTPQYGLIAEQVAKVDPDLVVRDENGEIYTVRYDAVNAMLLNEFLKEHHTVTELKDLAQKQQAMIAQQQKQIEALTAGLQKVGAAVAAQARELRTAAAQP